MIVATPEAFIASATDRTRTRVAHRHSIAPLSIPTALNNNRAGEPRIVELDWL